MTRNFRWLAFMVVGAAALSAQDISPYTSFTMFDKTFQFHGFVSEGYADSNDNNYLTMQTTNGGTFAMTDAGVNLSTQLTDHLRVGAQVYARDIGQLGKWHPTLDWGFVDYKFKDWFGIRAGKVKTVLGLYNDTQDLESLQTWALLPQSTYPLDLRATNIAHTGGDIYGNISLRKMGSLAYTGYAGLRSFDPWGGYYYFSANGGFNILQISGHTEGFDLRWNTPVPGLMIGSSWLNSTINRSGVWISGPFAGAAYGITDNPERTIAGYLDFVHDNWHFAAEFRNYNNVDEITSILFGPTPFPFNASDQESFESAAYRVNKHLELGTYYSHYHVDTPNAGDPNSSHINDNTFTARFDLTSNWDLKVEEHFMRGYGGTYSAHGFYTTQNPEGYKPNTDLLVVRTGWNF
ncbi:MAG: hypothetical protein WBE37_27700 [Bryobacteraceae bacterium]